MPYHETACEELHRKISETFVEPLEALLERSSALQEIRNQLGAIHSLVKNSKKKEALALIEKLLNETPS